MVFLICNNWIGIDEIAQSCDMLLVVSTMLQDILQAALYVETDFEQNSVATSVPSASSTNSETYLKPRNAEELCGGNNSVPVFETPDARMPCTNNSTLVSCLSVTNVAGDMSAIFRLSQDDFSDDIDDLSFVDLPLHTELPQSTESSTVTVSSTVTPNCHPDTNVALSARSSLSLVSSVFSEAHCLQLSKSVLPEKSNTNDILQAVVSTKRKRKFPGPAGVLPKLVRNYMINVCGNEVSTCHFLLLSDEV